MASVVALFWMRFGGAAGWLDLIAILAVPASLRLGRWLTGEEPFTAKLSPEFAPYEDYDQLMRRDEWYGRED